MTRDGIIADLTERLDRLEQQNQTLKRRMWGVGLTVAAVLLVGATLADSDRVDGKFGTIDARKIAISDSSGKPRIVMELDADEPTLTMFDHEGRQQIYLGINEAWDDAAYLAISSRLENGLVDKQAVLAATSSRTGAPGNAQLLLYDLAPKQKNAAGRHLLRMASGWRDSYKPYLEIKEFSKARPRQLDVGVLMAKPTESGRRLLLDTAPANATLSGVRVVPPK